ncbi:MAG: hypothetical protein AAFZ15_16115 [Bacteroidota bacterium]
MKKIFLLAILLAAIGAATCFYQPQNPVVNAADYATFMDENHLKKKRVALSEEIGFWKKKLTSNPGNYVFEKKLAGLSAKRFKLTGNPQDIHRSDSLLKSVNERLPGQVGVLHSLTANAITRHAFKEAQAYITQAYEIGEKRFVSSLLLTDVLLERGQFFSAKRYLLEATSESHFDYLIRDVKFQDQIGDLGRAIQQMEKALSKAEASGNPQVVHWSLSNLADMYGHDGRISQSYNTYLKALTYNPADLHSLKGIAWIAFSHDKNTAEAKRILHYLKSVHPVPDYDLMLAEIAIFENDAALAKELQESFIEEAGKPVYGSMYKGYLCELTSHRPNALAIAKTEVEERPHPTSYDLLAWAHFHNGNLKKAVELTENHVLNQTGEPVAQYHSGVILKEAGQYEKAEEYLEEALGAGYELGPVVAQEIKTHLEELDRRSLTASQETVAKVLDWFQYAKSRRFIKS